MTRKKIPALIILIILTLVTLVSCNKDFDSTNKPLPREIPSPLTNHILNPDSEIRGVWIASVYNIDYPSKPDLTAEELKKEIDIILEECERNKLNTIFFQVRPTCDALYKSELFPVSSVISTNGTLLFDPLEYILNEGHKRNIYVHAWVNPLRITMNTHDLESLSEKSPARRHPEWVVAYGDGKLYFDSGIPEVRDLIANGIREIVSNYDVDGVVFDDYFYPYPAYGDSGEKLEFDDAKSYLAYGGDYDNIDDWRRSNINKLIEQVYATVKETDSECQFGVSPFAVWQNNNGSNGGSNTSNLEAYHSLYCDAMAWVEGGYIDYISPQIYWDFNSKTAPYDVVARWWNSRLSGTNVKLYVSHASYKYEEGEWDDPTGELSEQISFSRSLKSYRGSICYGFDELKKNTRGASDEIIEAYRNEIIYTDIQSNQSHVTVTSPVSGSITYEDSTYLVGMSDPYYTLTLNGEKISQTKSGFFNAYVSLQPGENVFVFRQNGVEYPYVITYLTSSQAPQTNSADKIMYTKFPTDLFPSSSTAISGNILWVSCTAPYNSRVSVNIGGVVTQLSPISTPSKTYDPSGFVGVTYGANAYLPAVSPDGITDCGNIKFTVYHGGEYFTSPGCYLRVLGENARLCVKAKADYTELKISQTSLYYNDYTVQSAGMTDYAKSLYGGFYLLRMGGLVYADSVEEVPDTPSEEIKISSSMVTDLGKTTEFRLMCKDRPPYNACIEDDRFVVTFYNVSSADTPPPTINDNPIIKSCEVIRLDDRVRFSFELYDVNNFYGFDLKYESGIIALSLKNPISVDFSKDMPLSGIRIVLDAGHGGDDNGAAGAYFSNNIKVSEKDLNLKIVTEVYNSLVAMGADVKMIRSDDSTVPLQDRVDFLEAEMPDLCVSIHQNSMNYNVDITRIRGTLALWCMDSGRLLSDSLGKSVSASLGRKYIGSMYQMLAMCKNPKFPSALIEVGFMTSVEEYEQMFSGVGIKKAADGVVDGIINYFHRQGEFVK